MSRYLTWIWSKIKLFLKGCFNLIRNCTSILNTHASLLVAVATILLAFFTYRYIDEAQKMRIETKRLVDITIEQFKIKSYPSIHIAVDSPIIRNNIIFDRVVVSNSGEITMFSSSILLIHVFRKEERQLVFKHLFNTMYSKGEEKIPTFEYSTKILPSKLVILESRNIFNGENTLKNLQFFLIFIRFKVPYDENFSYEYYGHLLKKDLQRLGSKDSGYMWQTMLDIDVDNLARLYSKEFIEQRKGPPKILEFFKDFKSKK